MDLGLCGWRPIKISVLRSMTIEPLHLYLDWHCLRQKMLMQWTISGYGPALQYVLETKNELLESQPDVIVLAWRLQDVSPRLWFDFLSLSTAEVEQEIERIRLEFLQILKSLRGRTQVPILVNLFDRPNHLALGLVDVGHSQGQFRAILQINQMIIDTSVLYSSVFVLDFPAVVAKVGRQNFYDSRMGYVAQSPYTAVGWEALAQTYVRWFRSLFGANKKCLVLDCDNTLWGGIVAEDGIEGICIGGTWPGNAFTDFQRALKTMAHRGMILALNSKNEREIVLQVLQNHAEMVLREGDFAAMRINWQDKATNLREIAAELNIGMESMVFVDDNPAERDWVRRSLPEVAILDLPTDPSGYCDTLYEMWELDTLTFSEEDRQRNQMYRANANREALRQQMPSLDEFYRSLEMRVFCERMRPEIIQRVAQLTQRTNQFNLTTRRYTEAELEEWSNRKDAVIYTLRVIDRYGDNGVVGVGMAHLEEDRWVIENFLLSCRVIGRTIEDALLAWLVQVGKQLGAKAVLGKYLSTAKNNLVSGFYAKHGFKLQSRLDNGEEEWLIISTDYDFICPEWLEFWADGERITFTPARVA